MILRTTSVAPEFVCVYLTRVACGKTGLKPRVSGHFTVLRSFHLLCYPIQLQAFITEPFTNSCGCCWLMNKLQYLSI